MFNFYLGDSIPNWTDWIQAISSLLILALTGAMAFFAKKELNNWKEEKHHDIYIDALSNYRVSGLRIIWIINAYVNAFRQADKNSKMEYDRETNQERLILTNDFYNLKKFNEIIQEERPNLFSDLVKNTSFMSFLNKLETIQHKDKYVKLYNFYKKVDDQFFLLEFKLSELRKTIDYMENKETIVLLTSKMANNFIFSCFDTIEQVRTELAKFEDYKKANIKITSAD